MTNKNQTLYRHDQSTCGKLEGCHVVQHMINSFDLHHWLPELFPPEHCLRPRSRRFVAVELRRQGPESAQPGMFQKIEAVKVGMSVD